MPVNDDPWPAGTPCWVDCQVPDPSAAREFYTRLFGWEVYDARAGAGGYLMAYKNDKVVAGIGPRPADLIFSAWTTYLATDDVDATVARVEACGGELRMPPSDVFDSGRVAVAADPTGGTFGLWQAGLHHGSAVFNEHAAYRWNELHTHDYPRALEFYRQVFGYDYHRIGDATTPRYAAFTPSGAPHSVGGIRQADAADGEGPAYWLTWFQVDDVDESVRLAGELGAGVLSPPEITPFGRGAVLSAPQGETFGLVNPDEVDPEKALPPA